MLVFILNFIKVLMISKLRLKFVMQVLHKELRKNRGLIICVTVSFIIKGSKAFKKEHSINT